MKICEKCGSEKDDSDFILPKTTGYRSRQFCATCRKARLERREIAKENIKRSMADYRTQNREKLNCNQILKRFNLTKEQYTVLVDRQNGCCAICDASVSLAVDHDHATGLIRGMLCRPCNVALGMFKDNPDILERASDYIKTGGIL